MKGYCDEHGWYPGGVGCRECRRGRDLRAVYPPVRDVPRQAPTRPPLRAVAHACREYEEGNPRPLEGLLRALNRLS